MKRVWAAMIVATTIVLVAAGCSDASPPAPTPTALFATDEEAFAAAEETYRAYVDALNHVRSGGDADPFEFLTGQAYEAALTTRRQLEEAGLRIVGPTDVIRFTGHETSGAYIHATACVDSSRAAVVDENDVDRTPLDREDITSLQLSFLIEGTSLLLASSDSGSEEC